jgi:signal transduction histidine kinase
MLCLPDMKWISGAASTVDQHSFLILNTRLENRGAVDATERIPPQNSEFGDEVYDLLKGAVHDIRTQSRGMASSVQLLEGLLQESASTEEDSSLARLLAGLERTSAILVAIAEYANALPSARYSSHRIRLSSVVNEALLRLRPAISELDATITCGELPEVRGDRDRLRELFRYLIDNSLKYHGDSAPKIEIGAEPPSGSRVDPLLWVRDNGIGIESRHLHQLFRPFRRLHGPEIPGVGLGLVISKKIVESHGGIIYIDSNPGQGTTVFFSLPA